MQTSNSVAPSPGCAHTQHLPVSQTSQGVQQKVGAAVCEQVLGIALLVVQRTQQHTGPPQLSRSDGPGSVGGVGLMLSWQEHKLTILTQLLLNQREGGKLSEPEGQITDLKYAHLLCGGFEFGHVSLTLQPFKSCIKSEDSGAATSDIVLDQGFHKQGSCLVKTMMGCR